MMNIHPKKNNIELPFTQLWYNFSKQCEKENKAIAKANKQLKHKNGEHFSSKSMYDDTTFHQKRQSLNFKAKKLSELNEQNVSIANLIQNKQKQNEISNNIKFHQSFNKQSSTYEHQSVIDQPGNNTITNKGKGKEKVSDKILQIIQSNVIPFLVDKFIQVEDRATTKIKKLQSAINKQKLLIQDLKLGEKSMKQSIQELKDKIQRMETQNKQTNRHRMCECKTLVQVGNSPVCFSEDVPRQKQVSSPASSIGKITIEQHEQNLKQISHLLEELTTTIEQSGLRNQQKANQFQKQIKKLTQRQKIGEQKLEKEFAEKMLQLISTYNDNFVDLDKRMTYVEDFIDPSPQQPRQSANRILDVQKLKFKSNKSSTKFSN